MSVNDLLRKYDIHPKKSLGQNFLIELPTIKKIVSRLHVEPDDKVLEIGSGVGVMTKLLTEQAKFVAAVETDREMIKILEDEYGDIPNLHIIRGDIIDADLGNLLGSGEKWLFIGNIPYNITSPLLFHLRKYRHHFRYGLLMMQKEVAERLTASPGTKDYGIMSIGLQAVASIDKCFNVSKSSFYPQPSVESTVIKIDFENGPEYNIINFDLFIRLVRAAFSTRRKKMKNAIMQSSFIDIEENRLIKALGDCEISENSRAEELDIQRFADLANSLSEE